MSIEVYGKRGLPVRLIYLAVAAGWYVVTLGGRLVGKTGVVLCYHGILQKQRERFKWQMAKISVQAICDENKKGDSCHHNSLFSKVCVTFDDAFANLLDNALPVLETYHIPATIFAVAGNLGEAPHWKMPPGHPESNERTMTTGQLVFLSKHPLVKIGSHTVTHPDLTAISCDQVKTELADSKQQLEVLIGVPIEDLALPHGSYNEAVLTMARDAEYKRVYTLDSKPVDLPSGHAVMGRFSMSPDVWPIEFYLTCCGAYSWLFPFRRFVKWAGRIVRGVVQ